MILTSEPVEREWQTLRVYVYVYVIYKTSHKNQSSSRDDSKIVGPSLEKNTIFLINICRKYLLYTQLFVVINIPFHITFFLI